MQVLPYADLSTALAPLLDEPCVPAALRRFRQAPPEGVSFSARQKSDAKGLFALFSEPAFRDGALTRDVFKSSRELQTWLAKIAASNRYEAVAKVGDDLVGFVGLYPQTDHMRHVGSLLLGVTSKDQGRGIGSFLLQLMILTAWFAAGLSKIQLSVFCDNSRAVRLYQSAGFEVEGILRRFVRRDDQTRDVYLMALFLE